MSRARITIATSGPLCRNPRVHREADALAQDGHNVTVVTVAYHDRFERLDADLMREARYRKVRIDRRPSHPTGRLISFFERGLTKLARERHWQSPLAFGPFHALARTIRQQRCDLLIAHTELALAVAHRLRGAGLPVAADIEDWHSRDLLPDAQASRPLRLLEQIEGDLLRQARHVTATSQAMATALARAYHAPEPVVIPNTLPLTPNAVLEAGRLSSPTIPSLIWVSQTIGPGRGLEAFIRGWAQTRIASHLTLLGEAVPGFADKLRELIPASHAERFRLQAPVPPGELPATLCGHHIGLALEPASPDNKNLTISNKIFHYLDAGLAVVATPTAGQREVFAQDPRIGFLDDLADPNALALRLDELSSHPDQLSDRRAAARRLAEQQYCWEKSRLPLQRAVRHSLGVT